MEKMSEQLLLVLDDAGPIYMGVTKRGGLTIIINNNLVKS